MIYTLTVNPSLDYIVDVPSFKAAAVNRTQKERIVAGGKGINVSFMLKNLGTESKALGFTAGFTGKQIEKMVEEAGVAADFVHLEEGNSRINVKITGGANPVAAPNTAANAASNTVAAPNPLSEETEINAQGPSISATALQLLYSKVKTLSESDTLVLAGSIPSSLPDTLYCDLMKTLSAAKVNFVVDATKNLLLKALDYHPFLVKPNHHELGDLFGVSLSTAKEVVPYAKKLQEMGAKNVLVSMGKDGAVLAAETGEVFYSPAPKIQALYTVGAGDSMVAGFLAGWKEKGDYKYALKMGIASGSATASTEGFGTRERVLSLFPNQIDFIQ